MPLYFMRLAGWRNKGWKLSVVDGPAKNSRAGRFRRGGAVLPTIIAAASVWMVAMGGPLIVVASSPADHIVVALRLATVAEAVVHHGALLAIGA